MAKKKRGFVTYKSYMWVDKDPIIDALRTSVSDSKKSYAEIHEEGGPTPSTLRGWFSGNVRRPQFTTVAATARTIGCKGVMFNSRGIPYLVD